MVPPLGLSNKAIGKSRLIFSSIGTLGKRNIPTAAQTGDQVTSYDPSRTSRRPFEGELAAITLWPEVEKVFGHGYEVPSTLFITLYRSPHQRTSRSHWLYRVPVALRQLLARQHPQSMLLSGSMKPTSGNPLGNHLVGTR